MKNLVEFLDLIELKVRDQASEFSHTANVSAVSYSNPDTSFTVDSYEGMVAGDTVYINDGTIKLVKTIKSVETQISGTRLIKITGDYHTFQLGGTIKKTNAIDYLNDALILFSKFKPLEVSQNCIGDGTKEYAAPNLWKQDFSIIKTFEFPADEIPKSILDSKSYLVLNDENGDPVIQLVDAIDSGETFRIYYTTLQYFKTQTAADPPVEINPPESTASDVHFSCICNLAAANYLLGLAARYGQSTNNLISADSVDYKDKVDAYRRLAKEYLGQAASWLGISVDDLDKGGFRTGAAAANQTVTMKRYDGTALFRDQNIIEPN